MLLRKASALEEIKSSFLLQVSIYHVGLSGKWPDDSDPVNVEIFIFKSSQNVDLCLAGTAVD